jgi:chromosomal replication initiator protein
MSEWDDYRLFWSEAVKQIQAELTEQEYSLWFNRTNYLSSRQDTIIVSVPSSFYRDQVKSRYLSLIEHKLMELSGSRISLEFEVKSVSMENVPGKSSHSDSASSSMPRPANSSPGTPGSPANAGARSPVSPAAQYSQRNRSHPALKDAYTFDNFIIGENNAFAANAAMAIAKNPGTGYNPCLVYGGVGLGKTHLLQSIGNSVYGDFSDMKINYVTMENFTNEFIQAIREKKQHIFKNKYRHADVLLIDDIHFLQKKPETHEEIFHNFNALYDSNKQMVFTCDRPVSELKDLTDRLRSRFERGLNVDLQPPSYETRYAILKKKIEAAGIQIPEESVNLICENVTTNVRDLEAALTKLIAYAELVNKTITVDITKQQLKDFFSSPVQKNITISVIQRMVSEYFGVTVQELKSKRKTKTIAFPRQVAMYIARDITEYSTTEVGLEFGGRDHTTVMHACDRVKERMKTDPYLVSQLDNLKKDIREASNRS